jgi:hypothetical protein
MAQKTWRNFRLTLEWGAGVTCLIALIQASGSLTRFGIEGLVVCGSLAMTTAVIEHGWHRAPHRIGTPLRLALLIIATWAPLTILGWCIWPKRSGRPLVLFDFNELSGGAIQNNTDGPVYVTHVITSVGYRNSARPPQLDTIPVNQTFYPNPQPFPFAV